jgi:thiosulfate/3-mercaptopyruvate sulfurtransferase
MLLKKSLVFVFAAAVASIAVACGGDSSSPAKAAAGASPASSAAVTAYAHPELLAETSWLKDHVNDANLVIVDVRKKESYDANHIPNATWYDPARLKDDADKLHVISDAAFSKLAGDIGINNTKTVVIYDDSAGLSAARLWWVLDYYGVTNGKILNGGFPKWDKEGLPESKAATTVQPVAFAAKADPNVLCAIDYLKQVSSNKDPNVLILDVRTAAEYSGADVRSAKGGHVPGAVNLDYQRFITDSDPKVWKPAAEISKLLSDAGVKQGIQVITYCQTGVRASFALFTLKLMGVETVKNYDGSWAEWGNLKDTAIAQ